MINNSVFNQIKQILVERFAKDASLITPSVNLQKELGLDSLDAVDLLLTINETYQINISDAALDQIHTVSDLVGVIQQYTSK